MAKNSHKQSQHKNPDYLERNSIVTTTRSLSKIGIDKINKSELINRQLRD